MVYRIDYAAYSVRGTGREKNEDNLLCRNRFLPEVHKGTERIWQGSMYNRSPSLFCVFDGMGRNAPGEKASFLAAESFCRQFKRRGICGSDRDMGLFIETMCERANRDVQADSKRKYTGSSVAGIYMGTDGVLCFHVGDCRIYQMEGKKIKRLTEDHLLRIPGSGKRLLSQTLGMAKDGTVIMPDIRRHKYAGDSIFLLCTNGITKTLSDGTIAEILRQQTDVDHKVKMLCEEAVRQGSWDDITAIVIRMIKEGGGLMDKIHLPEHWNRWDIKEEIGAGAYGTVYRAEKDDDQGKVEVSAIKIIHIPRDGTEAMALYREYGSMDEVSRYYSDMVSDLVREIQTLMSVKGYRNIVQIEDYHVERNQANEYGWDIYIRMEYLQSLPDYLQNHEFHEEDAIRMGIDLCKALEDCEKVQIIHRDIKPDNILVSEAGDFKLGDFGVAKRLDTNNMSFSMKGTYSFMSPEVYYGRPYDLTADLYSLGLVLFRVLNHNRDPFVNTEKQIVHFRDKEEAMAVRMSGKDFPDPMDAGPEMSAVIRKACAFSSEDRYPTAAAMRMALEQVQNGTYQVNDAVPAQEEPASKEGKEIVPPSKEKAENHPSKPFRIMIGMAALVAMGMIAFSVIKPDISRTKQEERAVGEDLIIDHVKCSPDGDAVCTLDSKGTLTITGNGAVEATEDGFVLPWDNNRADIKKLILCNGITSIGYEAFSGCSFLSEVTLPSGLVEIEESAFMGCELLADIHNIPDSLQSIGCQAFDGTRWLKDREKESEYVKINDILLEYAGDKSEIVLPEEIWEISYSAFEGNKKLKRITLPRNLKIIRNDAFKECTNLAIIDNLEGNKNIDEIGCDAFDGTPWLHNLASIGKGFAIISKKLIVYQGQEKDITIPEGVKEILGCAFEDNEYVETILVPKSVKRIGEQAFYDCPYLKKINLEKANIKTIPFSALCQCPSLEEVYLPDSVEEIGEEAFEGCRSLEKISLPRNIKKIERNAFSECEKLKKVEGLPEDMDEDMIIDAFITTWWYNHVYDQE